MISIICLATVKPQRLAEWPAVLHSLVDTTHAEDEGCLRYDWYGRVPHPGDGPITTSRAYVLHEQWRDDEALTKHAARLQREFGPAPAGTTGALLAYFERFEAIFHDVQASDSMVGDPYPDVPS